MSVNSDGPAWFGSALDVKPSTLASIAEASAIEPSMATSLMPAHGVPAGAPAERRAAARMSLPVGRAFLELDDRRFAQLRDIGPGGAGVVLAGEAVPVDAVRRVTVHLAGQAAFAADVRIVRSSRVPASSRLRLGVSFTDLQAEGLQALARFMAREHLGELARLSLPHLNSDGIQHQNRGAIIKLLTGPAISDHKPLKVFRAGKLVPLDLELEPLDAAADVLVGRVHGDPIALGNGRDLTCLVSGRTSVLLFETAVRGRRGDRVVLSFPSEVIQTGCRDSQRAADRTDGSVTQVSFCHPHLGGETELRPIVELAARGIAIDVRPETDLVFLGEQLPSMKLHLPDGSSLTASGIIRGMRIVGDSVRCGIELLGFATEEQSARWHRHVFAALHPHIDPSPVPDVDAVWELYRSSTYVEKWIEPEQQAEVEHGFRTAWADLGTDCGRLLTLSRKNVPVGTIAANRLYPRTWLMHGLAVDKLQRQRANRQEFLEIAYELYSGIAYFFKHQSGCRYFLSYFEPGKSWNHRLYGEFVRGYLSGADQLYDSGYVLRRRVDDPTPPSPAPDAPPVRVGVATRGEKALLARVARQRLSPMVVDAFALYENDLAPSSGAGRADRASPGREILVARQGDEPVMAMLCAQSPGYVNPFGLMNLSWTLPLRQQPVPTRVHGALIERACAEYRARGISEFLMHEPQEAQLPMLRTLGFAQVHPAIRWLAKVDVLPAWLAYLSEELGYLRNAHSREEDNRGKVD